MRTILLVTAILLGLAAPALAQVSDPNLAETAEVRFTGSAAGDVAQTAASATPVAVYEFVRNKYEYALYHGSRSSSINTYYARRANDVDLASLLIAMYRSKGIPARYAVGTVRLPAADLVSWVGVRNLDLAVGLMKDQGIQGVAVAADRSTVDFEHVWVEAQVPFGNYRGVPGPAGPTSWVALDPSFKRRALEGEPIDVYPAVKFDYAAYYNAIKNNNPSQKDRNPREIYEERILAHLRAVHPGKTLEDVSDAGAIVAERSFLMPASLPYTVLPGTVRRYASVAEHDAAAAEPKRWTKRLTVTVSRQGKDASGQAVPLSPALLTRQFLLSDLSTKRLTITFVETCTPTCLVGVQLRLDGAGAGTLLTSDLRYNDRFAIELAMDAAPGISVSDADDVISATYFNNVVGGYYLIGTGGDTSNWSQVHRAAAQLIGANKQYAIVNDSSGVPYVDTDRDGLIEAGEPPLITYLPAMDALTGGLLYVAMSQYFAAMREDIERLDALAHVRSPIAGWVGVVSSVYDVEYLDGTAFSVMPGGLLIDMKGVRFYGVWRAGAASEFAGDHFELIGHVGSSLEHEIWQELTGYDAVSTVRGIQFALGTGAQLVDARKNATSDTMPAAYPQFGFGTQAPSPWVMYRWTLFTGRHVSWKPSDGSTRSFDVFKQTISSTTPGYRASLVQWRSSNGVHGWLENMDSLENQFNTLVASGNACCYTARFPDGSTHGPATPSTLRSQLQTYYDSVVNDPTWADFFDFFDENQGFVPSEYAYRDVAVPADFQDTRQVVDIRQNLYLTSPGTSRQFLIPSRKTSGESYRFTVFLRKIYGADGRLGSLGFEIQNQSFAGSGGYVDGRETREQATDTVNFNNAFFTDQNRISLVSNDLVRTPSTVDPVSTVTGNNFHDETDFTIPGRGLDYTFTRTYNSAPSAADTGLPMGFGWTHSYNVRLRANDYGRYPNKPAAQALENANGRTSSVTYVNERGGEVNYLVSDLGATPTWEVTPSTGTFDVLMLDTPAAGFHTVAFRNGVRYVFEGGDLRVPGTTARLARIEDPYGNKLLFAYAGGNLASVTDNVGAPGRTGLAFAYHPDNRLKEVRDWTGRAWSFGYDAGGNLTSITNPLGQTVRYTYHAGTHNLNEVILPADRNGDSVGGDVRTAFEYYRNGKAFFYSNALGHIEILDYDLYRKSTRVTDPRTFVREYFYNGDGQMTKLVEPDHGVLLFDNNADGLRFRKVDALGFTTDYSYRRDRSVTSAASDTYGNVTRERDPLGYTLDREYDHTLFDQPIRTIDKNGNVRTLAYYTVTDPAVGAVRGKLREVRATVGGVAGVLLQAMTYDPFGNLKELVEYIEPGNTVRKRVTTHTYDAYGLTLLETRTTTGTTPGVIVRTFTYDLLGRKLTETLLRRRSPTDATLVSLVTTRAYDALDRVTSVTDPIGNVEETTYDANGKVSAVTRRFRKSDGTFDARVVSRKTYDLADRLVREVDVYGYGTSFSYDAAGNLVLTVDANGHRLWHEYDAMGRRTAVVDENGHRTQTVYDLAGRVLRTIDPNGQATTFEYDALGRKVRATSPLGAQARWSYDGNGNVVRTLDANATAGLQPVNANGATVYTEYDELNRVVRVVDALDGPTRYTYDLTGNMTSLTDPKGQRTEFVYDDFGRLVTVIDPLVEAPADLVVRFTYDEAGNVLTVTDRKGQVTRFTYDNLNRRTRSDFLADASYEIRTYNIYGDLVGLQNKSVTYTYTYDAKHRLTSRKDSRLNRTMTYAYDPVDNLVRKVNFWGYTVDYQYDSTDRLVRERSANLLDVSYHYDPAGRLLNRILSNGAQTDYVYDADGRLTRLVNRTASATAVSDQTYAHDRVGNIVGLTDARGTATFTYDALARLKVADYPGTADDESYTYDAVGNRLTLTRPGATTSYAYNAGNRLLEARTTLASGATSVVTYGYDPNGNRTSRAAPTGTTTYRWDPKNRLTEIVGVATFVYDPLDYRIRRADVGGVARRYLLEGEHLEVVFDERYTSPIAVYLRGAVIDEVVVGRVSDFATGVIDDSYTYHHDHLRSVVGLSGHDGRTIETVAYGAFGARQRASGSSLNGLDYTGRERDPSGLLYYRARYYDPEVGRFLSEDPKGFAAGLNFYAYVDNNPLNANDPTGFFGWLAGLGAWGALLARDPGTYADIAFISADIGFIASQGWTFTNTLALGLDVGSALAPGVTGLGQGARAFLQTNILQRTVSRVAAEVDAALAHLSATRRGSTIDAGVRAEAHAAGLYSAPGRYAGPVRELGGQSNLGPDFFSMHHQWDMTTSGQWARGTHQLQYGNDLIFLNTHAVHRPIGMGTALNTSSLFGPSFGDFGNPFASGGYVLYPGRPNLNGSHSVYAK